MPPRLQLQQLLELEYRRAKIGTRLTQESERKHGLPNITIRF